MIFAQMKDGIIQNTIILENTDNLSLFMHNPLTQEVYDSLIRIDMIYPQPGIGWIFNNIVFTPPEASYTE